MGSGEIVAERKKQAIPRSDNESESEKKTDVQESCQWVKLKDRKF